jgi:1-acyl-sn-glycerol-3-phosphate acyltransferase
MQAFNAFHGNFFASSVAHTFDISRTSAIIWFCFRSSSSSLKKVFIMILALLHTLFSRLLLFIIMILCLVPAIILLALPTRWRYNRVFFWFSHYFFYVPITKALLMPIIVQGKENMPHEPAIIVANHQSSLDIPLVGAQLNCFPHVWLATNELLTSPIWRFILPRVAVLVDLASPVKAMRTLTEAINSVNGKKRHVVLFPEGARFADGQVHEFYGGFVILAKKTGRPVVPMRIFGLNRVYPKGTFVMKYHPIKLVIGRPMHMLEHETDEAFKKRVHEWFVHQKDFEKYRS